MILYPDKPDVIGTVIGTDNGNRIVAETIMLVKNGQLVCNS